MKNFSYIALFLLTSVLVLSAGCSSDTSTSSTLKTPVGAWFSGGGTSTKTLHIYDNGQAYCVNEYMYGSEPANEYGIESKGSTEYLKKMELLLNWEKIASNKYLLTMYDGRLELYNGQSEYYIEGGGKTVTLGTITVYDNDVIGWDIDDSGIKLRMERIG